MKKLLAVLLTIVLVFSVSSVAFAAASGTITDVTAPLNKNADPTTYDVKPGTVWVFPLSADMFTWSGTAGAAKEAVTTAQLRSGSITAKYSSNQSEIIKEVSLGSTTFENKTTACVKVEFVEEYAAVDPMDFRIHLFLAVRNTRKEASRITLEGSFGNAVKTVNANSTWVNIADGSVLKPTAYNANLDIELGGGVVVTTRVYKDQKYYAVAENMITVDDNAVVTKHPSIDHIIRIKAVNFKPAGKCVSLTDYGSNYHVYNASGAYLGTSRNPVEFSTRYYLSKEQISMDGSTLTSSSSTSSSSSSTIDGGSSSGSTTTTTTPSTTTGTAIGTATAKTQADAAVATAKANNTEIATVRFKDAASISTDALRTVSSTAAAAGKKGKVVADTMSGNAVAGRLTINPALAANLTGDIQLGAYVDSAKIKSTYDKFNKYYKNNVAVVSLAHKGSYGMTVTVAAKANLANMNTQNLYFYSYDKSNNRYDRITNPSYYVDSSGYLHFNTNTGNDIIISDGALAVK